MADPYHGLSDLDQDGDVDGDDWTLDRDSNRDGVISKDERQSGFDRQNATSARIIAEQRRAEAQSYYDSGERQRDIDAGKQPKYKSPDEEYKASLGTAGSANFANKAGDDLATGAVRSGDTYISNYDRLSNFDKDSQGVPILGWASGADARAAAARAGDKEAQNQRFWEELMARAPTPEDLSVEYAKERQIDGTRVDADWDPSMRDARADHWSVAAQRNALEALQDVYKQGGMTDADRARQQIARSQTGQATRAQREADMAALQARGQGNSGANVASMLGAQAYGANSLANADAQMLIAAEQRALQAMQSAGGLGAQARGQSFSEDATRRNAIDDFNRWNTEYSRAFAGNEDQYRRGLENRNVGYENRSRDSTANARQTSYQNYERGVAGMTNQYQGDQSRRLQEGARQDQANQAAAGVVGTVLSEAF